MFQSLTPTTINLESCRLDFSNYVEVKRKKKYKFCKGAIKFNSKLEVDKGLGQTTGLVSCFFAWLTSLIKESNFYEIFYSTKFLLS